jgi:hypothetical protein
MRNNPYRFARNVVLYIALSPAFRAHGFFLRAFLPANATRLCEARFGTLTLYDGEMFRTVASGPHGVKVIASTYQRRGLGLQSDGARCYNSQEFYG